MKAFWALFRIDLLLLLRKRAVIFFNVLVPLTTFFVLCELFHAERDAGVANRVVATLLVVGAIANGFFGAGMRAVQEREADILRRFKAAPISPLPILAASLGSGVVIFAPTAILVFVLANRVYRTPIPSGLFALVVLLVLGVLAFRALGLIVASVVNSTQESQILMQLLYLPMLLLSGVTIPRSLLPAWASRVGDLLPSTALFRGFEGILFRMKGIVDVGAEVAALALTTAAGLFVSAQLFRWEKDERIRPAAKLWVALALAPFAALGAWRAVG